MLRPKRSLSRHRQVLMTKIRKAGMWALVHRRQSQGRSSTSFQRTGVTGHHFGLAREKLEFLWSRTRADDGRPDLRGSALDTDTLAFGVSDRLLQCVDEEWIPVSSFPRLSQPRSRQVEVRPNSLEHAPQIHVKLCHRGPTPVPVSVVDLEDLESGLEDECVGNHRIVRLIRELFDVQILLDDPIRVRQERPSGAERVPELVDVQLIVGRDEGQSRVSIPELGIYVDQLPYELMLFGIEAATGQMEHHWVGPLELRQGSPSAGSVGELVVGKRLTFTDVAAHVASKL